MDTLSKSRNLPRVITNLPARNDRWTNTSIPISIQDPPAHHLFEIINIVFGLLIILWSTINSLRNQRLTYGFLFLINSLLCYWMETIGDWGQHLVYSPRFMRHRLLEWLPLKSPNDPVFRSPTRCIGLRIR
jgi:hypothetical protein